MTHFNPHARMQDLDAQFDCQGCGKELDDNDIKYGKKSFPKLCVACYTSQA